MSKYRVNYHDSSKFVYGSVIKEYDTLEAAKKRALELIKQYEPSRHTDIIIEKVERLLYTKYGEDMEGLVKALEVKE